MNDLNVLLIALISFIAGAATLSLIVLQRRRYWQRRQQSGRLRQMPDGDDLFPIRVNQFRKLLPQLRREKRLQLHASTGVDITFVAQDGEDMLLADFFEYKRDGFFVEIGAYDGVYLSNTYALEQLGWRGVLIEPIPRRHAQAVANRPNSIVIHAAIGADATGTTTITEVKSADNDRDAGTLSYVNGASDIDHKVSQRSTETVTHTVPFLTFDNAMQLHEISADSGIDVLSIDCEGMDFEILRSINLNKWAPRVIIIEYVRQPLIEHMRACGYTAALRLRANTIFVRDHADMARLTANRFWETVTPDVAPQTA